MFRDHILQYTKLYFFFFLVFIKARFHPTTRAAASNHLQKHIGASYRILIFAKNLQYLEQAADQETGEWTWQSGHVCDHQRVGRGLPGAAAFFPGGREFIPRVSQVHTTSQQTPYHQPVFGLFCYPSIFFLILRVMLLLPPPPPPPPPLLFLLMFLLSIKREFVYVSEIITYVFFQ